jgi:hypothetical protein
MRTVRRLQAGLHLTSDPDLGFDPSQSYEGMAHFAGTGPEGETCGSCLYWKGGDWRNRRCEMFVVMRGVGNKLIPANAEACRYWNSEGPDVDPARPFGAVTCRKEMV